MTVTTERRRAGTAVRLVRATVCAPIRSAPDRTRAGARRERRRSRRTPVAPLPTATAAAACAALVTAGSDRRWGGIAVWALALAAHAVLAGAVWRSRAVPPVARSSTRITVQVHDAPPPAPAPRSAIAAPPNAPAHRVAPQRALRAPRAAGPTPPSPPPPPVEVIGLSLESTSEAGQGPAFAVGNTLDGATAAAARPRTPVAVDPPAGPNRVARGVPRPGSLLVPPRRIHEVKPRYPDAQRAAGVEADVLLVISLDAAGQVLSVSVGRSSGDGAFDESAQKAAREERFSPALRDGVPVPTTFTFTTRFRLDTP